MRVSALALTGWAAEANNGMVCAMQAHLLCSGGDSIEPDITEEHLQMAPTIRARYHSQYKGKF